MDNNRTFTIIKPNAVAAGHTGKIIDAIIAGGFTLKAMKLIFLSRDQAEKFYAIHRGKYFFDTLVAFMTSGPLVVAVIEKENAITAFRDLIGSTNPAKATPGTIRKLYGESIIRNAIHASDSDENAREEWSHFFTVEDIIEAGYIPTEDID